MKHIFSLVVLIFISASSWAQDLIGIVNLPVGISTDINARLLLKKYDDLFDTNSIVINRPGGNGIIGVNALLDDHVNEQKSLLFSAHGTILELTTDKYSQLIPVIRLVKQPMVLIVRKDFPANTFDEYVAYAQAHPEKVNHAIASPNLTLPFVLKVEERNKYKTNRILYYSGRPEIDVMKGVVDSHWSNALTVIGTGIENQIKILAVAGTHRIKGLGPQVVYGDDPKIGLHYTQQTIWASAKMDRAKVEKLNTRFNAILKSPWGQETFAKYGVTIEGGSINEAAHEWQQLRARDAENKRKYPVPSSK